MAAFARILSTSTRPISSLRVPAFHCSRAYDVIAEPPVLLITNRSHILRHRHMQILILTDTHFGKSFNSHTHVNVTFIFSDNRRASKGDILF